MKPKERYRQHQDGRLYLRNKDHRDVILDDKYHNFVIYKDEDGNEITYWCRHPHYGLVCYFHDISMIDVERHVIHCLENNLVGTRMFSFIGEDKQSFILTFTTSSTTRVYGTHDGQVWKLAGFNLAGERLNNVVGRFGTNGLINFVYKTGGASSLPCTIYYFNYDEENESWEYDVQNITVLVPQTGGTNNRISFICETSDGCIVCGRDGVNTTEKDEIFFKITSNGATQIGVVENTQHWISDYCCIGATYDDEIYCLNPDCISQGTIDITYYNTLDMWYSSDGGRNWTVETLWFGAVSSQNQRWKYNRSGRIKMEMRIGAVYIYFYEPQKTGFHFFVGQYGSYTEETLPDYVDVPIEENPCGKHSSQILSDEYVRLIINPAFESEVYSMPQVNFSDYVTDDVVNPSSTSSSYNARRYEKVRSDYKMFVDGNMGNQITSFYYLSFQIGNYLFYFDNMRFQINDNCFAIKYGTSSDEEAMEHIIEGDYCLE